MSASICPQCGTDNSASPGAARCIRCDTPLGQTAATAIGAPSLVAVGPSGVASVAPAPILSPHSAEPPTTLSTGPIAEQASRPEPASPYSADHINEQADRLIALGYRLVWVCGIVLILIAIYMTRPQAAVPPPPPGVATIVASSASGLAPASGQPAPIPASAPPATGVTVINDYLTFLQKIDLQRVGLATTLTQAMSGADTGGAASLAQSAQTLMRDFLAQKPPPECSDLSNAYFRMLQDQTGMIGKAGATLQSGNTRDAQAAHDAGAPQIAAEAQSADYALAQLCTAQHIDKPFTIITEPNTPPSSAAPAQPQPTAPATPTTAPTTANGVGGYN